MKSLLPKDLRKSYPFKSHWLETDLMHQMHYLDEGEGHPIIMVHGNPTWSFFYRNLVLGLRRQYRCIVPDHIGCGLSDKPQDYPYVLQNHIDNLVRLVESLDLQKFHLIVHDWGGPIGIGMAQKFPDRLKKVTILNTAVFTSSRIPRRISICKTPILGSFLMRGLNAFARCATFMAVEKPLNSLVKKAYIFPYNNWHNRIAIARFVQDIPLSNEQHPSWKTLKRIERGLSLLNKKPMMICWGAKDFCFNDHYLKEWLRRFIDVQLHRYSDAGHYVLEDAGDEILDCIQEFLKNRVGST